jgi:acid stress-induced BolA-like protein IbaG/YrbA
MPMAAFEIEALIKQAIPDAEVEIRDLAGDGDHYAARVISLAFAGLSRIKQHQAVYAALFYNDRSSSPGDGMLKSYDEICKILGFLGKDPDGFAFRGCSEPLKSAELPSSGDAVEDLIKRAEACSDDDPLFVVSIGACTNLASAILRKPEIIHKIVVVWLGGNTYDWPDNREFNLSQDPIATGVLFDSGVPFIQVPALGVTGFLLTTVAELEACIGGANDVCDYLVENVSSYHSDHFAWSKAIWDIGTIGLLVNPACASLKTVASPVICGKYYGFDPRRHLIRCVTSLNRDAIFKDMFQKLRGIENHSR